MGIRDNQDVNAKEPRFRSLFCTLKRTPLGVVRGAFRRGTAKNIPTWALREDHVMPSPKHGFFHVVKETGAGTAGTPSRTFPGPRGPVSQHPPVVRLAPKKFRLLQSAARNSGALTPGRCRH